MGDAAADKDHNRRDRAHANHCRRVGYFYPLHKTGSFDIEQLRPHGDHNEVVRSMMKRRLELPGARSFAFDVRLWLDAATRILAGNPVGSAY
jgi:hypothetical protein